MTGDSKSTGTTGCAATSILGYHCFLDIPQIPRKLLSAPGGLTGKPSTGTTKPRSKYKVFSDSYLCPGKTLGAQPASLLDGLEGPSTSYQWSPDYARCREPWAGTPGGAA